MSRLEELKSELEELRLAHIRADMNIQSLFCAIKRSENKLDKLRQEAKTLTVTKKVENKAETKSQIKKGEKVMRIEVSNAGYSMVVEEMPKEDIYSKRKA